MRLYDAHTHLSGEELYPEWEKYLDLFVQAGGKGLINSGASEEYNLRGIEIVREIANGKLKINLSSQGENGKLVAGATIGYHPGECGMQEPSVVRTEIITEENIQQKMDGLRVLYEANKKYIVAIGECGIDTFYPGTEDQLPLQKKLFAMHCDLARELNLPLVVHIRQDFDAGLEILKNYTDLTIHFHCRSFGREEVARLERASVERGWKLFIGFCGNITYKNAQNLRDSLFQVPLDQLLLETDAPWLSPQAVRGTTNHPANIQYTYEFVAQLLGISPDQLCEIVEKNYKKIYMK